MLIVRSPMRISYIGGGSDFPSFYSEKQGNVIGAAINQFIYVFSNPLSEIARETVRFTYRKTESVSDLGEIEHPVLREMLLDLKWKQRINIGTFSELPAGVGLGGSSAFTVALAKLLFTQSNSVMTPEALAKYAIRVEREILDEPGGIQDQLHSAHGGFNHFSFTGAEPVITKTQMPDTFAMYLDLRQILVWVGSPRESGSLAKITNKFAKNDDADISFTSQLAHTASSQILESRRDQERFEILCEAINLGWEAKKRFTGQPDKNVEIIESRATRAGARAIKLCGAGQSGFMLILFDAENRDKILSELSDFSIIAPKIVQTGASLIHHDI